MLKPKHSCVLAFLICSMTYRAVMTFFASTRAEDEQNEPSEPPPSSYGFWSEFKAHVVSHGGLHIFVYKILRLVGCLALLGLSIATLIIDEIELEDRQDIQFTYADQEPLGWMGALARWGKKKRKHRRKEVEQLTQTEWLQFAMCMTYLYASLLSLLCVTTKPYTKRIQSGFTSLTAWVPTHVTLLLLVTFGVYAWRDIFPLATYTLTPIDLPAAFLKENAVLVYLLWTKIAVLCYTAVFIPLLMPTVYIPVDPKNPSSNPPPEQTCSLLSFILFSFLDSTVLLAHKVPHLSHDQLPPLADYDEAKNLREKSFTNIDPFYAPGNKKKLRQRHIFWGLMKTLRKEYAYLVILLTIHTFAGYAAPVGVNRLLYYMEKNGEDAFVRPWVWLIWLFCGPMIYSTSFQAYIFYATRNLVWVEAIITQLIFEHALRIRVKAETKSSSSSVKASSESGSASASGSSTPAASTSALPVQESEHDRDISTASTIVDPNEASSDSSGTIGGKTLVGTLRKKLRSPFSRKEKAATPEPKPVPKAIADDSAEGNLVGKLNNLISTDLGNITDGRDFIMLIVYAPLQLALGISFLYVILGWSAFVGLTVMVLCMPLPGFVGKAMQDVQKERMKRTDARVQNVTETMNVIRMIKLFGWEGKVNEKIAQFREAEIVWLWKKQLLDLVNGNINFIIPTVIMKQALSASIVFSAMSVFDLLREQLHVIIWTLTAVVQAKVSIDRVDTFLHDTELLDTYDQELNRDEAALTTGDAVLPTTNNKAVAATLRSSTPPSERSGDIGFSDATFMWSVGDAEINDGALTPSKRKFVFRVDGELIFKKNAINLVVGPTGSGKTSLLMALLGEMHFVQSGPSSWYNLPRDGGVSYAAQESWVQNETIKVRESSFDACFVDALLRITSYLCGLERDLELFEAGDQTEVGEKGLTLSGGQKARITLARAIYSRAEIILLDDILAALDVHTAKWIVDKCFRGDLIKDRTIILVTHNVAMTTPIAHFVVSLGADGRIANQGEASEVIAHDQELEKELKEERETLAKTEEIVDDAVPAPEDDKKVAGKLIAAEEIEVGHVGWPAVRLYLVALGGKHPIFFFVAFIGALCANEAIYSFLTWFLGYWASKYAEVDDPTLVSVSYYLSVYVSILGVALLTYATAFLVYVYGNIRASKSIHKQLINAVLGTTLRWLDITPTSRIITRCTQDIRAVDDRISQSLQWLVEMTVSMIIKFAAVLLFTPVFILPGVIAAILGGWLGQIYIAAQLSVKREMSNAKAPVVGHFGAAMAGLTSIRAYGAQESFKAESLTRINKYTRAARSFYNLNRWICIRIDALGSILAVILATYLLYGRQQGASNTGFALNMAVGFSGMILWWVRILNEFEVQGNSLERIQGYISVDQEPKPTEAGKPPAYWPSSGDIRVENLSARYSETGPKVLHDLSFHIKSGERVGVVGRTGSGKSSLTLSLLRCIYTDGEVYYDGKLTNSINLDALRTNITIIPQVPELLSGTLRQNLDPFDQFDDATLNSALRAAGLFSLQNDEDEGRITLDTAISSGGSNLSVGQRQILALARAIVRGSKLLILDEATSAIDYKTDSVIQSSLRHELGGDVTLITIAHRLQTIMDADKIMVLDAGKIVEFDSPKELLKKEGGKLRALVDESGDRDLLISMAIGKTDI
ncbi:hypothetical protein ONZ45_g2613 [Pleurotus djamor]|nr:hypothetical protein ONZ45_g2613 [Pleurotus djamor]